MRRGFTLIELLVVIGIIGVLIAITLVIGGQVLTGAKSRTTADVIRQLNSITDQWVQLEDRPLPSKYVFNFGALPTNDWEYALADVRVSGGGVTDPAIESGARAMALLASRAELAEAISTLPKDFVEAVDLRAVNASGAIVGNEPGKPVMSVRVIDAWKRPIRFVHPAFDGGWGDYWNGTSMVARPVTRDLNEQRGGVIQTTQNIRRSIMPVDPTLPINAGAIGDADEGLCEGKAAYWYSTGTDGDPGTRDDNVYATQPRYPSSTSGL